MNYGLREYQGLFRLIACICKQNYESVMLEFFILLVRKFKAADKKLSFGAELHKIVMNKSFLCPF